MPDLRLPLVIAGIAIIIQTWMLIRMRSDLDVAVQRARDVEDYVTASAGWQPSFCVADRQRSFCSRDVVDTVYATEDAREWMNAWQPAAPWARRSP